jgi:hypothetical protein
MPEEFGVGQAGSAEEQTEASQGTAPSLSGTGTGEGVSLATPAPGDQLDEGKSTDEPGPGEEVTETALDDEGNEVEVPAGRIETCRECGANQQVDFGPDFSDVAAQYTCLACGARNTVRFPENTTGGVERQIQRNSQRDGVLGDEDQARRVLGDEVVDQHLKEHQERVKSAEERNGEEEASSEGASEEQGR